MTRGTRLPILTLLLIAANLVAAFMVLLNPPLVDQFGFSAAHPTFLTAFTSMFLHQNVLHLMGNMVFLAAVGASVELATGWYRFLFVYFGSGLCGILLHWAITRHIQNYPPLIGASGALAGCAGYYAARYTRLKVPVGPNLSASILAVAIIWLVLQVLGGVIRLGDPGQAVSYWAHLGGFIAGIVLSVAFRGPDIGQERLDREVLDHMRARGPGAEAVAARRHLERHPRDVATLRSLIEALDTLGETDELAQMLLRLLDLADPSEKDEILTRLVAVGGAGKLPSTRRMSLAKEYAANKPELAEALYASAAETGDEVEKPEALFALAVVQAGAKPAESKATAKLLVEKFPDHPAATRARARGML